MQPSQESRISPGERANHPVLLYDGECGLCNKAVRFLLRIDRRGRLRFAPLQGPSAQAYLRSRGLPTEDFDSMMLVPDWQRRDGADPLMRTNAALAAVKETGGPWAMLRILGVIPAPLRDLLYKVVARFRYRLFGPYRPTPLPRAEWQQRFLP
jgi:predicted DCC family thiol-disulfide oxidoreductase YuxK